jgi:hypothetical protein
MFYQTHAQDVLNFVRDRWTECAIVLVLNSFPGTSFRFNLCYFFSEELGMGEDSILIFQFDTVVGCSVSTSVLLFSQVHFERQLFLFKVT